MLCEKCHQNQASTVLTKTVNGKSTTIHMCSECAFKAGYANLFHNFSLNNILSDYETTSVQRKKRCPQCGSSFEEILSTGKIGCSECYEVFKAELLPTIEKIHGKAYHVGKQPNCFAPKEQSEVDLLEELKAKLQKAINEQEFENAAMLRDEIKKLEHENE